MIKYYYPIPEVISYLVSKNKNAEKILEIGPGSQPFPLATHFIDHKSQSDRVLVLDVSQEKIPFEDHYFDFVYARHVLEDLKNPQMAFNELVRVGKTGYIETPSVIAEVSKHVDCNQPAYKGYIHHRYLFWNKENTLFCIPKYPVIEHIKTLHVEHKLDDPFNWNNYYMWDQKDKVNIKELDQDMDYNLFTDYLPILNQAVHYSLQTCQAFKNVVRKQNRQDQNNL
jgi:predicted SAM-dependent methyltransferase